jgi:transposase InsO family protein
MRAWRSLLAAVLDAWSRRVVGYAISRPADGQNCRLILSSSRGALHPVC